MDENGSKIEDPFRRYRRRPEKPKRPGASTGERPVAQWKGPLPPPRTSGTFAVASGNPSELQDTIPAAEKPDRDPVLQDESRNPSPFSYKGQAPGTPVSDEARARRHALLADIAADFERRNTGTHSRPAGRRSGELPLTPPQESVTQQPARHSQEQIAATESSHSSGELSVSDSPQKVSGELVIPPWKPTNELTSPNRNSGELTVHRQATPLPRRTSGQNSASNRASGETAARRKASGHVAAAAVSPAELPTKQEALQVTDDSAFSESPETSVSVPQHKESDHAGARSPRRRRARERSTDRTAAETWQASALVGVLSIALLGYAFNIGSLQGSAQNILNDFVSSGQGSAVAASLSRMLPWLLLLPMFVLFFAILHTLLGLVGLRRRRQRGGSKTKRQRSAVDLFKRAALAHGVPARIAYHGFQTLQPHVPAGRVLNLNDNLETDLGLAPAVVRSLRLALMTKVDRDTDPSMRLAPAETVLAMLLSTLQAPRRRTVSATPVTVPGDPRSHR